MDRLSAKRWMTDLLHLIGGGLAHVPPEDIEKMRDAIAFCINSLDGHWSQTPGESLRICESAKQILDRLSQRVTSQEISAVSVTVCWTVADLVTAPTQPPQEAQANG